TDDLRRRIDRMVIGFTADEKPVTAGMLKATGALTVLLREAVKPNLVQTLENTPAFIHGGPFANIAHGCNSLVATKTALKLADVVVTEAGFGADLGAEKFFSIKCRYGKLQPAAVVVVATVRALKMHGGLAKDQLGGQNSDALLRGCSNLFQHCENLSGFGLPVVVAINRFPADSSEELDLLRRECSVRNLPIALSEVWSRGGAGGEELARQVLRVLAGQTGEFCHLYEDGDSLKAKIETVARRIYRADSVIYTPAAEKGLAMAEKAGLAGAPVCMAKTQYSFSDDPKKIGCPRGFSLTVRDVRLAVGAGFVVAICGDIMTMPGLPKVPAAEQIDIDQSGLVTGLF
ncbi:MAG: formate--tetrahydrofolate ligase, partial [Negativicutes bacterium]|nr:formate--tetrahydrofolate ligase [Negativicutes bacterium]